MLNWLDHFFGRVGSAIGTEVAKAVHWALHALASVVFAVFANVKKAWAYAVTAFDSFLHSAEAFASSVYRWMAWIWKVEIPKILRWAAKELALLAADLAKLRNWAILELAKLLLWAKAQFLAVYRWVIRTVYDPLKRYADLIWTDLLKWGYTAWTYITHPYMLAELLIMPLVDTLEKYAWQVAGKLGTFVLALVTKNIKRLLTLAEDIITAVF